MKGTNRALLIGAMAALAAVGSPAPASRRVDPKSNQNIAAMPFDIRRVLGIRMLPPGGNANYIKRPFHTTAEMKRKAIKAKNRRRHKLAMKRKH